MLHESCTRLGHVMFFLRLSHIIYCLHSRHDKYYNTCFSIPIIRLRLYRLKSYLLIHNHHRLACIVDWLISMETWLVIISKRFKKYNTLYMQKSLFHVQFIPLSYSIPLNSILYHCVSSRAGAGCVSDVPGKELLVDISPLYIGNQMNSNQT